VTRYTRDNHPLAHGSTTGQLTGKYGGYSLASAIECVVDKAYYPDDKANTSKKYMEYSVVVIGTGTKTIIPTVRQLVSGGGFANGDYLVLQETTGTVDSPNNPNFDRGTTDSSKWNGDRVLVDFGGGNQSVPIIVGVLPHPATKYGAKRSDGAQRKISWNKSTCLIDKDGNIEVDLVDDGTVTVKSKNTTFTIDDKNKKTTIDIGNGAAQLVVDGDAKKITIKSQGQTVCELGAATDAMLLGTTYRNSEAQLNTQLNAQLQTASAQFTAAAAQLTAASGPLAIPIVGGTLAAPSVASAGSLMLAAAQALQQAATALNQFESSAQTYLSQHNKLD